jgi:membrane protease YdiL (CAAX protease family)
MGKSKQVLLFLGICFTLSWLIMVPLDTWAVTMGAHAKWLELLSHALAMLAPGLGCIIVKRSLRGEPLPALRFSRSHIALYCAVVGACALLWLGPRLIGVFFKDVTIKHVDAETAMYMSVYLPLGLLGAYGEELGWRGFLLPELSSAIGPRRGTLLHGLIWGAWHWGLLIPMLIYGMRCRATDPGLSNAMIQGTILPMVFAPLSCMCLGVTFAFLYKRYNSILVVTLLHFSYDYFRDGREEFLQPVSPAGTIGAAGIMDGALQTIWMLVIPLALLLFAREFRRANAGSAQEPPATAAEG